MSIQIEAIVQYYRVVLFIMLCKVVVTFESVDETIVCDKFMKAIAQHFSVTLFIMLCRAHESAVSNHSPMIAEGRGSQATNSFLCNF